MSLDPLDPDGERGVVINTASVALRMGSRTISLGSSRGRYFGYGAPHGP